MAVANAAVELIEDPPLRQIMGRDGREIVERELVNEHIVSATLGLCDELPIEVGIDRKAPKVPGAKAAFRGPVERA